MIPDIGLETSNSDMNNLEQPVQTREIVQPPVNLPTDPINAPMNDQKMMSSV